MATEFSYKLKQTGKEVQEALNKLCDNQDEYGKDLPSNSPLVADGIGKVKFIAPFSVDDTYLNYSDTTNKVSIKVDKLATKDDLKNVQLKSNLKVNLDEVSDETYPSTSAIKNFVNDKIVNLNKENNLTGSIPDSDLIEKYFKLKKLKSNVLYTASLSTQVGTDTVPNLPCLIYQTGNINNTSASVNLLILYRNNWRYIEAINNGSSLSIDSDKAYNFDELGSGETTSKIGNLSDLKTSEKGNIVSAINDVFDLITATDGKIGDLSSLTTSEKSNLVAAINSIKGSGDSKTKLSEFIDDLGNNPVHTHSIYQEKLPLVSSEGYLKGNVDGSYTWEKISAVPFNILSGEPSDNEKLKTAFDEKQNKLSLGANIYFDIEGRLAATDTTYEAGTGVNIYQNPEKTKWFISLADTGTKIELVYSDTLPIEIPTANNFNKIYSIKSTEETDEKNVREEYYAVRQSDGSYTWELVGRSIKAQLTNYVPITRKVNEKNLSSDIVLTLDDIKDGSSRVLTKGTVTSVIVNENGYTPNNGVVTLPDYFVKSEMTNLLGQKQDKLTAGTNIKIENNTISADCYGKFGEIQGEVEDDTKITTYVSNQLSSFKTNNVDTVAADVNNLKTAKQNIITKDTELVAKSIDASLKYLTTEPTSANTDGLKIVVLNNEPEARYDGYLYIILA